MNTVRVGALTLTAAMLAACGPQETRPPAVQPPADPAAVAPVAPAVGHSLDVADLPGAGVNTALAVQGMLVPSADMDPDLAAVLGLFSGSAAPQPLRLDSPLALGRSLAQAFGRAPAQGELRPLATAPRSYPLPRGTVTYDARGLRTSSDQPTNAYIEIDVRRDTRMEQTWTATAWAERRGWDGVTERYEVPTSATASLSRTGKKVASGAMTMTPGDCFYQSGPTALNVSGWAGRETNAPASASFKYAWTDAGITFDGQGQITSKSKSVKAAAKLDLRGATQNRCDPATFIFKPTQADLVASLDVPLHKVETRVYLRGLSNLEFSATALRTDKWYQGVGGDLNAALLYDGKPVVTAFGPLKDGGDTDLLPGDGVKVKYVKNGKVVEETLPQALVTLQGLLPR